MASHTSRTNLPTELSEAELIEIVNSEGNSTTKINMYNMEDRTVLSFLMFYDIRPGSNYISNTLLYNLYKEWSGKDIKKIEFSRIVNKFILPMGYTNSTGDKHYYMISLDAFTMNNKLVELKDTTQRQDKTKLKNYKKHFDSFVNFYELKSGKVQIEGFILYYLYDKWTYKNRNYNPLGYNQFINFCKLYFPKFKRIGTYNNDFLVFSISKTIFEYITDQELADTRQGHRQAHAQKEKTNKKKRRTISGPKKTSKS